MKITGVMIQYYKACDRELWYFGNQINMNYDNDFISMGKLINEESYKREKKNLLIDDTIAIDFIKKRGEITIYEIKKSSKLEEPAKYQLYYYLWYLKNKLGKIVRGEVVYPKEKTSDTLYLTPEIEKEIQLIIEDIPKIISRNSPPPIPRKPYCKNCSYYNLCYV